MAITILQVNIQSWKANNYILKCSLSNHNPDVILLNEISTSTNIVPKIYGYKSLHKCAEPYSGVAVFVKSHLQFHFIEFETDGDLIAIKLFTVFGPIIIATSYTPPRIPSLPLIELNKILNFNLPTLIISDFNAVHQCFDNGKVSNSRGKQLFSLISAKHLLFLGPTFSTYKQGTRRGKPDLILCNTQFQLFHHMIQEGEPIGSDHIPIILKIQTKPFLVLSENKINIRKMNIDAYKQEFQNITYESLDGKPFTSIDSTLDKIENDIRKATVKSCPLTKTKIIKTYTPNKEITAKLKLLQHYYNFYYSVGFPTIHEINQLKKTSCLGNSGS